MSASAKSIGMSSQHPNEGGGAGIVRLRLGGSETAWERRFVALPERAREAERLYRDMGFEVRTEDLRPDELDPRCGACAEAICTSYVVIYTRRPSESES